MRFRHDSRRSRQNPRRSNGIIFSQWNLQIFVFGSLTKEENRSFPNTSSFLLFQLFDEENYLNQHGANHYIFTTEAHLIPLTGKLREKVWEESTDRSKFDEFTMKNISVRKETRKSTKSKDCLSIQCRSRPFSTRHQLPLSANLLYQLDEMVGLN